MHWYENYKDTIIFFISTFGMDNRIKASFPPLFLVAPKEVVMFGFLVELLHFL